MTLAREMPNIERYKTAPVLLCVGEWGREGSGEECEGERCIGLRLMNGEGGGG